MSTCKAEITIGGETHTVVVDRLGHGPFPIIIAGHAEIYYKLYSLAFKQYSKQTGKDASSKFSFYFPRLYWCQGAPLSKLPENVQKKITMDDMVRHIDEVRSSLAEQGLLNTKAGKVAVGGHSGFSAIALHHACRYPDRHLATDLEGPVPFFNEQYGKEMGLFLKGNASKERLASLKKGGYGPFKIALDEQTMSTFARFNNAYDKMGPAFFCDFNRSHRREVWGAKKLNMLMMKHFFLELMPGYDCRPLLRKIDTPINVNAGLYDTSPSYLWYDSLDKGGVGFFEQKRELRSIAGRVLKRQRRSLRQGKKGGRSVTVYANSAHWALMEEPAKRLSVLDKFVGQNLKDSFEPPTPASGFIPK